MSGEVTLVEKATMATAAELAERFADPSTSQVYRLSQAARLLHSSRMPVVHAGLDMGLLRQPDTYNLHASAVEMQGEIFDRSELMELNEHAFVRTVWGRELSKRWGITQVELVEVAQQADIEPVIRQSIGNDSGKSYFGYFDFDQITELEAVLRRKKMFKGKSAAKKIITNLGLDF